VRRVPFHVPLDRGHTNGAYARLYRFSMRSMPPLRYSIKLARPTRTSPLCSANSARHENPNGTQSGTRHGCLLSMQRFDIERPMWYDVGPRDGGSRWHIDSHVHSGG
jgi:hypothetical protein